MEDDSYPRDDAGAIRVRYAEQTELSLLQLQERIDRIIDLMVMSTDIGIAPDKPLEDQVRGSQGVTADLTRVLRLNYNPTLELILAIASGVSIAGGVTTFLRLWGRYAKVRAEAAKSKTVVEVEKLKREIVRDLRDDMKRHKRDHLAIEELEPAATVLDNAAQALIEIESVELTVYPPQESSKE